MKDDKEQRYIENRIACIQASIAGMCIGANLKGLKGSEWHYNDGELGRRFIEKDLQKIIKYLKRKQL